MGVGQPVLVSRAARSCRLFHGTPWRFRERSLGVSLRGLTGEFQVELQGDLVPTGSAFQTLVAFAVVTAALLSPL
jgi:hypothetical protein